MGWSVGRGCPLPTEEGVRCAPSPEIKKKFFLVQCVQKNFVFRPKGGGASPSDPSLNTPLPEAGDNDRQWQAPGAQQQ